MVASISEPLPAASGGPSSFSSKNSPGLIILTPVFNRKPLYPTWQGHWHCLTKMKRNKVKVLNNPKILSQLETLQFFKDFRCWRRSGRENWDSFDGVANVKRDMMSIFRDNLSKLFSTWQHSKKSTRMGIELKSRCCKQYLGGIWTLDFCNRDLTARPSFNGAMRNSWNCVSDNGNFW